MIFKKSGRTSYAKEAAILLLQFHCFLSQRKAHHACRAFDKETTGRSNPAADRHSKPACSKDLSLVVKQLTEAGVCSNWSTKRSHSAIKMRNNLLSSLNNEEMCSWLIENIVPCYIFK